MFAKNSIRFRASPCITVLMVMLRLLLLATYGDHSGVTFGLQAYAQSKKDQVLVEIDIPACQSMLIDT